MNNGTLVTSIIKSTRRVRDQYDAAISRAAHQCGITIAAFQRRMCPRRSIRSSVRA